MLLSSSTLLSLPILAKLTVVFTCTSLPLNLYISIFGCGCGFGFEQKFGRIDGFGEKKGTDRRICIPPYSPPSLQILRKQAAFSFAVLCLIVFCCSVVFGAVGLFRSDMLLIFLHGLAMILLRDSLSVRSFLIAAMTRYSGFFLLSLVTRFACDIGQLAKIWI